MTVTDPDRLASTRPHRTAAASFARNALRRLWWLLPPHVRRRRHLLDPVNRACLDAGAPPLATTRMRQGHLMTLDLRSGTEWLTHYTGEFDDARSAMAQALVRRPDDVAVDVGANIGLWTVPLAIRAATVGARVVAVEPVPSNADRLVENLDRNGVGPCTDVVRTALSDRPGTAELTLREDFAGGAATGNAAVAIADGTDDRFASVTVPVRTLDDLLDELSPGATVTVVKVDIEGHEDRFLTGAARTLRRCRPAVFIEWNPIYYLRRGVDATTAVSPLLAELSYCCLRQQGDRWIDGGTRFWSDRELDDLVLLPQEHPMRTALLAAR